MSGLGFGKGQLASGVAEENSLSPEGCNDCNVNSPHKRGIRKRHTIHQTEPEEVKEVRITFLILMFIKISIVN